MWECEGTLSVLCTVTLWHSSLLLWWPSPPSPAPWDLQCPAGEIPARIHSLYTPSEKLGFERGWLSGSTGSWVIIVLCALVGWCFLFVGFWATCQIMLFKCIYWHFKRSFSYFEQCASSLSLTHTHIYGKCFSTRENPNSDLWMSAWKISLFKNDWAPINYIRMQFYPCYHFEKAQPGSTTCTHMWLKCHYTVLPYEKMGFLVQTRTHWVWLLLFLNAWQDTARSMIFRWVVCSHFWNDLSPLTAL